LSKGKEIQVDSAYQGFIKIYPRVKTSIKSSKLSYLTENDRAYNRFLLLRRMEIENIFAQVRVFKIFSTTYRNKRKRFGLRMNLVAGITVD